MQMPSHGLRTDRARRDRSRSATPVRSSGPLAPSAVDAALSDESMPMLAEVGVRVDRGHLRQDPRDAGDDALLDSLAQQLEMLHEQQSQIRRLLDQAGRRRPDRVAR